LQFYIFRSSYPALFLPASQATPTGTPSKPKLTPEEKQAIVEARKALKEISTCAEHFAPALTNVVTCMLATQLKLEKQPVRFDILSIYLNLFFNQTRSQFHFVGCNYDFLISV
jgi:hypothetical protein